MRLLYTLFFGIITLYIGCRSNKSKLVAEISFYKVPLGCHAVDLGCGSLAKPVLQEFDRLDEVDTAWINYEGSILAVRWNNDSIKNGRNTIIEEINKSFGIYISEVPTSIHDSLLTTFYSNRANWYDALRVDELSRKEASILAEKLISQLKNYVSVANETLDSLQNDFQRIFADEFINSRYRDPWKKYTKEELEEIENKLSLNLQKAGEKYLGKDEMPYVEVRLPKRYYKNED